MANGSFKIKKSANLDPQVGSVVTDKGDIAYNVSTDKLELYNGAADRMVQEAKAATLANKTLDNSNTVTLKDTLLTIQDDGDATKQAKFEASGISAGQTRTLTIPNASTTIVGTDVSQVLTNKTINGPDNTLTNIADTSLSTISTAGKVSNSATTATSANTASAIVARDGSGDFSAGTITANLTGNASGTAANVTGIVTEAHGGTNQSTYATGDTLYASASNTLSKRTIGSTGDVYTVSGGVPIWTPPAAAFLAFTTKTGNYNIQNTDDVILVSGTNTQTLPTAVGITGKVFRIKKTDADSATVITTIDTTSSQTMDGLTLRHLTTQYEEYAFVSDGANWQVLEHRYSTFMKSGSFTYDAFGTVSANNSWYRRVGAAMEVTIGVTPGTTTGSTFAINMMTNYAIDSAQFTASVTQLVGIASRATNASNNVATDATGPWYLFLDGTSTTQIYACSNTSSQAYNKTLGNSWNSGDKAMFRFTVPITNWED